MTELLCFLGLCLILLALGCFTIWAGAAAIGGMKDSLLGSWLNLLGRHYNQKDEISQVREYAEALSHSGKQQVSRLDNRVQTVAKRAEQSRIDMMTQNRALTARVLTLERYIAALSAPNKIGRGSTLERLKALEAPFWNLRNCAEQFPVVGEGAEPSQESDG
jgi:hypothetical protein